MDSFLQKRKKVTLSLGGPCPLSDLTRRCKMKILHVNSAFPPAYAYGGGLRVLYDLAKEQVNRGHEVTVFTTDAYDSHQRLRFHQNPMNMEGVVVYHFRNISNLLAHKNLSVAPSLAFALSEMIGDFDIIHLHEYRSFHSVAVRLLAKRHEIPYVLNAYGALPIALQKKVLKAAFDRFGGRRIVQDARMFIAQSKEEESEALEIGLDPSRIRLVYNGIDVDRFREMPDFGAFREKHGIGNETKILLFLGRIHKSKGIDFALRAFSRIAEKRDDTVFVVAGPDDGYRSQYERLAEELGIAERVKFVGFVGDNEKISALHDADLFIHTVRYMGSVGLAPLEAILCGTPVVVTAQCGEVIEEARCGYIVGYGDTDELEKTLLNALDSPNATEDMVRRGKEYILQYLDRKRTVDRIDEIYRVCLKMN
jgi:glycosyltransferase involved in cell wall biosynthesis